MRCSDIFKVNSLRLKIIREGCSCNYYNAGTEIFLKDIFTETVCPFLLYQMVPYYETFHLGGFFPWMKDRDSVIVQCPWAVNIEVRRNWISNRIEVYGVISAVKGNCFCGYRKGEIVELEIFRAKKLCLKVYRLLYPHLQAVALRSDNRPPVSIQCSEEGGTIFEIL